MKDTTLTLEERKELERNENVVKATKKRILYTAAFKKHFMKEYHAGKGPTQIFREAGFNTKVLGSKRIERAAAHWREAEKKGILGDMKFNGDKDKD